MVNGSATLVHSLVEADLVDEYRLMIHPVVVDAGLRMFPDVADMKLLRLTDARSYESGVAVLVYEPRED
jgi:dihydrofolate reductase